MRHAELYDFTNMDLIGELQSRGFLWAERRTVDVPGGIDAQVCYSTGWLIEDEVVLRAEEGTDA